MDKTRSDNWGGKREGAGAKALYGEPTKAMKIPESRHDEIRSILKGEDKLTQVRAIIEEWNSKIADKSTQSPRWKNAAMLLNQLNDVIGER
ncbi:hypothetical protein [Candidatus Venteria ishoeyi]|uniref:Uncharacterized protein n=1 Tax=Candidatus Venteria ishoeyi TaxID=1899563 RepID=A0A1H6FAI4_9GAMM|nr:hypothetical protein [Candidatus Venteria ishoeyi]SEH06381.1 Uncharacterised protein [Candidatus Venteria ishoeyi]